MTRGPRAALGTPVEVAIPKPRTVALLVHDQEAMRVRTHVVETLTSQVSRGIRLQPDLKETREIRLKADPTAAARSEA